MSEVQTSLRIKPFGKKRRIKDISTDERWGIFLSREFENVETFVLLDWFIADFNSKSLSYRMTDNYGFTQQALYASAQGMAILAGMKNPILKIAKELDLSIDQETLPTKVNGNRVSINYVSFGVEAEELQKTHANRFIREISKNKMEIEIPPFRFKLFYLPPLPIATSEKGHIMHSIKGFANIRKRRIEINVFPPRDYESIFKNLVHEIFHVCFLKEWDVKKAEGVELKIEEYVKIFFEKCINEWKSECNAILEDLKNTIETKLSVFRETDFALKKFHESFVKAKSVIETFRKFYDAVAEEKVKVTKL